MTESKTSGRKEESTAKPRENGDEATATPKTTDEPAQREAEKKAPPSRDEIAQQVVRVLSSASGRPEHKIREEWRLKDDLGMSEPVRENLAPSFTEIVKKYKQAVISRTQCEELETVQAAIELVYGKVK